MIPFPIITDWIKFFSFLYILLQICLLNSPEPEIESSPLFNVHVKSSHLPSQAIINFLKYF